MLLRPLNTALGAIQNLSLTCPRPLFFGFANTPMPPICIQQIAEQMPRLKQPFVAAYDMPQPSVRFCYRINAVFAHSRSPLYRQARCELQPAALRRLVAACTNNARFLRGPGSRLSESHEYRLTTASSRLRFASRLMRSVMRR